VKLGRERRRAFRRSLLGYNTRDVDLFLKETAAERERLEDALTRVEALMAEWQCDPEPALPRSAPTRREGRIQVISVAPSQREFDEIPDAGLRIFGNALGSALPGQPVAALERHPVESAPKPAASRAHTRSAVVGARRGRRMAAFVAVCAAVLAILWFEFSDHLPEIPYGAVNAHTAPAPARPRGANTAGEPAKSLMFTISAIKTCWIRTVVDGGQQMERLLQPNETVMLHATNEVLLRVGDATAVTLLINNRPIKPLGRSGEVVTRLITRANYSTLLQPES
jgi:hypothetical protein